MTLRGGLIGAGFFAYNHFNAWREVEGAEIVAVCDVDESKARQAAADYSIESVYTDARQMMREAKLDFVDIVTTPESHRFLVELAAEHKLHTICQKPLSISMSDARAMVATCEQAGVQLMVHENFRWQYPMQLAREHSTTIGDLFYGRIEFRTGYDIYAVQPYLAQDERFIIRDLGIHLLDLARFFMGEVESLMCYTQRVNHKIKAEDVATIMLKMTSGATCLVTCSYATKNQPDHFPETTVYLEGNQGTVQLGHGYQLKVVHGSEVLTPEIVPQKLAWMRPPRHVVQDSVIRIQQHWVNCLTTGTESQTSGRDNLKTLELVFGAYQSADGGQPYLMGTL
jgi:predicted dehydrogenase